MDGEDIRDVAVRDGGIRLGQLLKLAGIAASGADAKSLLLSGAVRVNGEPEGRRGRQLAAGDVVRAANDAVRVVRHDPRAGARMP